MKKRWIVLCIVIGIIVLAMGSCTAFRMKWQYEFDKRLEALAKQGHPVSLDDIEDAAALPEGVANAADIYAKAFSAYVEPTEEQKALLPLSGTFEPAPNAPLPPEVIDTLRAFLEANKQTLDLLDEGTKIPDCRYPRVREGNLLSNAYYVQIKDCAKLQIERTLYFSATGQKEQAVATCLTTLKFADSLKRETCLIDYLVLIAMYSMNCESINKLLSWTLLPEEDLCRLQSAVAGLHDPLGFQKAMISERCVAIDFTRQPLSKAAPTASATDLFFKRLYRAAGFEAKELNMILDYTEKYINAAELPLPQRSPAYDHVAEEIAALITWQMYLAEAVSYANIGKIDLRVAGCLRCAETALAIERYRLKYKQLPETLNALAPEFMAEPPIDPVDGMPLRYLRRDIGYTVYTIGGDGTDDGGLTLQEMKDKGLGSGWDIGDHPFTVTR